MEIPGLGTVTEDEYEYDSLVSAPIPVPEDFHAAIRAFLALDDKALGPADVWNHVTFAGHEVTVQRGGEGARVTKVGPYDGHLTNTPPDVLYEP